MAAIIIDGKKVSEQVNAKSKNQVLCLKEKYGIVPGLAVVLVGENPASQVYVSKKVQMCAELGIYSEKIELPESTSQEELLKVIERLNSDEKIHGILVQSPVPAQINESVIVNAILPQKDVDCFHPENVGKMFLGERNGFLPCTPWGITELLESYHISTSGKHVVILGRSNIVGKPMMALLLGRGNVGDATVTVCHSKTADLPDIVRTADIVIAAIGKPEFVKAEMLKDGAVVIDVGINRVQDSSAKRGYRLVGDVDYHSAIDKVSCITPVPAGVGPMSIAMLMQNAIRACKMSIDRVRS